MKILVWILGYCIIYLFIFWLNYCIIWKKKKKNCSVHCATRRPSILLELRPYEEVVYLIFKILSFILIFRINDTNLLIKWIYICVCVNNLMTALARPLICCQEIICHVNTWRTMPLSLIRSNSYTQYSKLQNKTADK